MALFFYYALKVFGCSGLLYGYYFIALRNKAFHYWNRFYLLATVFLSLVLPLISINIYTLPGESLNAIRVIQLVTEKSQRTTELVSQQFGQHFTWSTMIMIAYYLVTIIMVVALFRSLEEIFQLIRKNKIQRIGSVKLIYTSIDESPFSFFNYIFWKEELDMDSDPGRQIFNHELVHVKENHSLDKLFIELARTIFWFNPIFRIIKKELGIVHEFIADKKSVGNNKALFAEMLLETGSFSGKLAVSNHFLSSSLKRRWSMIHPGKRNKIFYFSRIISLFVGSVMFLFASLAFKTKIFSPKKHVEFLSRIRHHNFISPTQQSPEPTDIDEEEPEVTVYNFNDRNKLFVSAIDRIDEDIPENIIKRDKKSEFVLKVKERRAPVYPELTSPRLIIYPNKTSGEFIMGAGSAENWFMNVDIFDSQNNLIRKEKITRQIVNTIHAVCRFDFSGLKKGTYLVNVVSSDSRYRQTYKLVKDY